MTSVRVRLTAWNGGVLALLLCTFALAAYTFLRYATIAQVDRTLEEQVQIAITDIRQSVRNAGRIDSVALAIAARDLEARGFQVTIPVGMPNTIVLGHVLVLREGERPAAIAPRDSGMAYIDADDLVGKVGEVRDDDEADESFSVSGRRGGVRALAELVDSVSPAIRVVATQPMHEPLELLETAREAILVMLPIGILLALALGYLLAGRALQPIAAMTSEARGIGARNLHERLTVTDARDELGQLASTFNDVLQRIELAMAQQRRFTADASHELRTPVALIRAEADVALSGVGQEREEYRAALVGIRDGSEQLSRIVNDLFLLARSDAGQTLGSPAPVYLDEIVTSSVQSMRALAERRGVSLSVEAPGEVPYHGDDELLRRVVRNLLDNAIKYARGPGHVRVALARDGEVYRVSVRDEGPGISSEDQPHIFDRFYRGDNARGHSESEHGAGAGLGLAIAREIAELHGGRLELRHSSSAGSWFELVLPVVD